MSSPTGRSARVAELIREEVASLLTKGIKDPRVGFVSVMNVRMSSDLRYANVYVSLYGSDKEKKSSLVALQNSAGWLRRELGKHLRMRVTPELRFFPDDTLDRVYHLEEVIQTIHEERAAAPMIRATFAELVEELKQTDSFLLVSHINPDGDAVGSLMGLYHLLRALGKRKISVALSDQVPVRYRTLPGAKNIVGPDAEPPAFDLAIMVDVNKLERVGKVGDWITPDKRVMCIDHHLEENPEAQIGIIDPDYAAASEMIVELFHAAEIPLSQEAATCIYIAQITDTGGYRYGNTNSRSHRMAAELHETGIDASSICRDIFEVLSLAKYELMKRALSRTEIAYNGEVAHTWLNDQDLAEVGGKKEDLDGIVNLPRNIEGVKLGILFHGIDESASKMSFRALGDFNAADFMKLYGGGGHASAAAARVDRGLDDLRQDVLAKLGEYFGASKS